MLLISNMAFEEKKWLDLRDSGLRIVLLGIVSLALALIIYSRLDGPNEGQPIMITSELKSIANGILLMTFMSIISVGYGLYRIFRAEQMRGFTTNNFMSYITSVFSDNLYWKVMAISSLAYGVFFAFLSQIFIYRNDISFTEQEITIPSISVTTCCNLLGYVPMLSIYLTDHFLILITPVNIILAVMVSLLVGFNISLNLYVLKLNKKLLSSKKISSAVGSVGATSALFIGCPTCAGSLFSVLLGFGSGATISLLIYFQTIFIVISLPALIISPFLIAREIRMISACKK
jgi:hypothetical protein